MREQVTRAHERAATGVTQRAWARRLQAVALQAVELADLEAVVAGTTVQRRDRGVVVHREHVVAALAEDHQPAVDRCVVVDAFERLLAHCGVVVRIGGGGVRQVVVQHGHEGGVVGIQRGAGGLARDAARAAQQEDVVGGLVGALDSGVPPPDRHGVHTVIGVTAVEHVDDVVAVGAERTGSVDHHRVGAGLAIDRERVAAGVSQCGLHIGHRLQLVDDEEVFAITHRCEGAHSARRIAAVDAGLAAAVSGAQNAALRHGLCGSVGQEGVGCAKEGLVEIDLVAVVVAEDAREPAVRCRAMRDHTTQVHIGAVAGVGSVEVYTRCAPVVTEDADVVASQDLRIRIEADVVAHTQHHVAQHGVDQPMADHFRCVLDQQHRATRQQVQVFALHRAFAHREARVADQCLHQHDARVLVDFGQVDAVRGARTDGARRVELRVDLEIVIVIELRQGVAGACGRVADAAAQRVKVDRVAEDIGQIVADAVVARVADRATARGQRDIALGIDGVHLQRIGAEGLGDAAQGCQHVLGTPDLRNEHAGCIAQSGRRVVSLQRARDATATLQNVGIDLEEVIRRTDAANAFEATDAVVTGNHRDVATRHIGVKAGTAVVAVRRAADRVDDATRRVQLDVAPDRRDAADLQVAGHFGHRDVAIGDHADVAEVQDVGVREHVHQRPARRAGDVDVARVRNDAFRGVGCRAVLVGDVGVGRAAGEHTARNELRRPRGRRTEVGRDRDQNTRRGSAHIGRAGEGGTSARVALIDLDLRCQRADGLVPAMLQLHVHRVLRRQAVEAHEDAAVGCLADRAVAPLQATLVDEDVVASIDAAEAVGAGRAVIALHDLEAQAVRIVVADAAQVGPGLQAVGTHNAQAGREDVAQRVVDDRDADGVVDFVGELDERVREQVAGLGVLDRHQRRLPVVRHIERERAVGLHADEDFMVRRRWQPVQHDDLADLHVVVGLVRQRDRLVAVAEREEREAAGGLGNAGGTAGFEQGLAAVVVDDVVDLEGGLAACLVGIPAHAMAAIDRDVDGLRHRAVGGDHQRGAGAALQHDISVPGDAARTVRAVDFGQQRQRAQHCQVRGVERRVAADARGGNDRHAVAGGHRRADAAVQRLVLSAGRQTVEHRVGMVTVVRDVGDEDAQVHAFATLDDRRTRDDVELGIKTHSLARRGTRGAREATGLRAGFHTPMHFVIAGLHAHASALNLGARTNRGGRAAGEALAGMVAVVPRDRAVVDHDVGVGVGEGEEATAFGTCSRIHLGRRRRSHADVALGLDHRARADQGVVVRRVHGSRVGIPLLNEAAARVDGIGRRIALGDARDFHPATRRDRGCQQAGRDGRRFDDGRIRVTEGRHPAATTFGRDSRLAVARRRRDGAQRHVALPEQLVIAAAARHVDDEFMRIAADGRSDVEPGLGQ